MRVFLDGVDFTKDLRTRASPDGLEVKFGFGLKPARYQLEFHLGPGIVIPLTVDALDLQVGAWMLVPLPDDDHGWGQELQKGSRRHVYHLLGRALRIWPLGKGEWIASFLGEDWAFDAVDLREAKHKVLERSVQDLLSLAARAAGLKVPVPPGKSTRFDLIG